MSQSPKMKLLVTGFKDFGGETNPTQKIAKALDGLEFGEVEVAGIVVDVLWEGSWAAIAAKIDSFKPNAVISLGLASGISGIELETTGRNKQGEELDNHKEKPKHPYIVKDGPGMLSTSLPVNYLLDTLAYEKGERVSILPNIAPGEVLQARLSDHAGEY
ncbi:MAG: hypothetical protein AAF570_24145, partial [Bacteroidota bacterium]